MESKFFIIKANKFIHAINNIKKIISLLFILNVITINLTLKNSKAQFFYNNGAEISIRQGAYVKIGGSVSNDNYGELENQGIVKIDDSFTNNANTYGNGDYIIKGNWYNNNIFTSGNSNVILDGGNQNIGGSLATYFNNLILQGNGIKQLLINSYVLGTLSLNDQELATGNFKIFVENPSPSSITRTTGFVSSTGQGMLSRKTLSNSIYLFPVGSSSGTLRYRPVEITPA
ncbi:MAG TPA: hypothetical protein P5250_07470, partial [Bacteroidales bacterium]|nr:hypothetical protein [Bacteroidales bacterium]